MNNVKIQWHSGFAAAIDLELAENRNALIYEKELNLNTKPLAIDLLVIKKIGNELIANEIGKLFRKYNIMEYKSPEDHLDVDTFYKSIAYACLYKSYGKMVNERPAKDITITIVREAKPNGLFRYFKEHNIEYINPYNGIYYVLDNVLFPTQIIVTKELSKTNHTWLKALTDSMKKVDMENLLIKIESLKTKFDRELADSVLEVSINANKHIVEELRGDENMCQALLEIMEPEINKIKDDLTKSITESVTQSVTESVTQSVTESVTQSVRNTEVSCAVKSFRDFGINDIQIKETLIKNFKLSPKEADAFL